MLKYWMLSQSHGLQLVFPSLNRNNYMIFHEKIWKRSKSISITVRFSKFKPIMSVRFRKLFGTDALIYYHPMLSFSWGFL